MPSILWLLCGWAVIFLVLWKPNMKCYITGEDCKCNAMSSMRPCPQDVQEADDVLSLEEVATLIHPPQKSAYIEDRDAAL